MIKNKFCQALRLYFHKRVIFAHYIEENRLKTTIYSICLSIYKAECQKSPFSNVFFSFFYEKNNLPIDKKFLISYNSY